MYGHFPADQSAVRIRKVYMLLFLPVCSASVGTQTFQGSLRWSAAAREFPQGTKFTFPKDRQPSWKDKVLCVQPTPKCLKASCVRTSMHPLSSVGFLRRIWECRFQHWQKQSKSQGFAKTIKSASSIILVQWFYRASVEYLFCGNKIMQLHNCSL